MNKSCLTVAVVFMLLCVMAAFSMEYEQGLPVSETSEDFLYFRLYNPHPYRMFCVVQSGGEEYMANLYPGKYSPWYPRVNPMSWSCRS